MLITERAKRKINTLLDSTNDCINYPKTNSAGSNPVVSTNIINTIIIRNIIK